MNARGISFPLVAVFLLGLAWMREPAALGAGDEQDRITELERRLETLEHRFKNQSTQREVADLRSRVIELERAERDNRNDSSGTLTASQRNDFSQLKRENATLKRSLSLLESRLSTSDQAASQSKREIDRLQSKVSTLQSRVDRLER